MLTEFCASSCQETAITEPMTGLYYDGRPYQLHNDRRVSACSFEHFGADYNQAQKIADNWAAAAAVAYPIIMADKTAIVYVERDGEDAPKVAEVQHHV